MLWLCQTDFNTLNVAMIENIKLKNLNEFLALSLEIKTLAALFYKSLYTQDLKG